MFVIDLFSGVGGLSLGFEKAGFKTVLAIEYNPEIAKGYQANFPETDVLVADLSNLDLVEIFAKYRNLVNSVVIGGPPCQGFSQKGKRIGLQDERNFLFRQFINTIEIVRPTAFLIENVPGLLSAEGGFFLSEILDTFDQMGYKLSYQVLDASEYGVPQARKRAFIVGYGQDSEFSWPEKELDKVGVDDAICDLPRLTSGQGADEVPYPTEPLSAYQARMRVGSECISNHIATKHSALVLERLRLIPEGGTRSDLPKEHLTKSIHSGTWSRLHRNLPSRTITTRFDTPSSGMFTLPDQDRCLTVREAARLQSFPDSFIFTGTKSNQMLQVGNAVPPMLAEAVAKRIKETLGLNI